MTAHQSKVDDYEEINMNSFDLRNSISNIKLNKWGKITYSIKSLRFL